jgi:serine/threonine-protein kinase
MPRPFPAIPHGSAPFTDPPARGGGKSVLFAILSILVIGLVAASAILFLPKHGTLVVTVAGPGNKPIDTFQVLLNGKDRCRTSPCRVSGLEAGTHLVRVVAPGFQQTADQAVKVQPGEEAVLNLALAPTSEGTGIKVAAEGRGLMLHVDGREVGLLPAELKDLTPGEHTLKIVDKNERYQTYEQRVTVERDKMVTVEPRLKLAKGLAVIRAGQNAADARVLLVSGNERRPIPNLPIKIDIATTKPYSLVATKKGFQDYKQDITFDDGQAEKTFIIDLIPEADTRAEEPPPRERPRPVARAPVARAPVARSKPAPAPVKRAATVAASDVEEPPPVETAAANGTLNISSSPPSSVVLDGKPLGSTPRTGLSVAPGPHTVTFIHPEHGRKTRSVVVVAGKTVSANISFP